MTRKRTPFSYWVNQQLRLVLRGLIGLVTAKSGNKRLDVVSEHIDRILLVRANFRMGSALLTLPAIAQFRGNFPGARIDFVGSGMSAALFKNHPIDHHYALTRRFPSASWAYLALLRRLRRSRYDLAVELSGGSSSMGAFIVGLSGARFRVGTRGKRDRWFNVKIPRISERNKYRALPAFLIAMGLLPTQIRRSLTLTAAEKTAGQKRIDELTPANGPVVGLFIGGRDRWDKRWPIENFSQLADALCSQGLQVVVFAGPEESGLMPGLGQKLPPGTVFVFEPSIRLFGAMIASCSLFVTSDTGPMHLGCAVGVRTVAIFQRPTFQRWGPPASLAHILYQSGGVPTEQVLGVCLSELSRPASTAVFLDGSEGPLT